MDGSGVVSKDDFADAIWFCGRIDDVSKNKFEAALLELRDPAGDRFQGTRAIFESKAALLSCLSKAGEIQTRDDRFPKTQLSVLLVLLFGLLAGPLLGRRY